MISTFSFAIQLTTLITIYLIIIAVIKHLKNSFTIKTFSKLGLKKFFFFSTLKMDINKNMPTNIIFNESFPVNICKVKGTNSYDFYAMPYWS